MHPSHTHHVPSCTIRLPDGTRVTRRVLLSAPLSQLFALADANGAGGWAPGSYALVSQFPRRTLKPGSDGTLVDAGLGEGQLALMLERLHALEGA